MSVEATDYTREFVKEAEGWGVVFEPKPTDWVAVTGFAQRTPLGDTAQTWAGRLSGQSGVRTLESVFGRSSVRIGAPLPPDYDPYALLMKGVQGQDGRMVFGDKKAGLSAIAAMNIHLAREALRMAGLLSDNGIVLREGVNPYRMGHWAASGISSTQNLILIQEAVANGEGFGRGYEDVAMKVFPENERGRMAMHIGYFGESGGTSEACATGLSNIVQAVKAVKSGDLDYAVAGGSEYGLNEFPDMTIAAFIAVHALTEYQGDPTKASRPFEKNRRGFVAGSGGAFLVLERLDLAMRRGANILALIHGVGKSMDGRRSDGKFRPTESDPEKVAVAMAKALYDKSVGALAIPDFIVAHATSTPPGDLNEALAYQRVFREKLREVVVTAPKSSYGHLLGGAGSVAAVEAVQILNEGQIGPILNYEEPDPEIDMLNLVTGNPATGRFRLGLVLASGFHGHNVALALAKPTPELLEELAKF